MSESRETDADKMPDDRELEEPSTEKEPDEEPKDGDDESDDVDHQAVGIGVVEPAEDAASGESVTPPHPTAAETATADDAPPTDAASDEVKRDAAAAEGADESE